MVRQSITIFFILFPIFIFAQSVTDSLVLHLRADQGITLTSGKVSAWADVSGDATTESFDQGTAAARPVVVDTLGFTSVRFDSAQWVDEGDELSINPNTSDYTIEMWMVLKNTTFSRIFASMAAGVSNKGFEILYDATNLTCIVADGSGAYWFNKSADFSTYKNAIAHVVFSFDRDGSQKYYINNTEAATQTTSNSVDITSTSGFFRFGARVNNQTPFIGYLYELRIYKGKALSPTEVEQNYNAGIFDNNVSSSSSSSSSSSKFKAFSGSNKFKGW